MFSKEQYSESHAILHAMQMFSGNMWKVMTKGILLSKFLSTQHEIAFLILGVRRSRGNINLQYVYYVFVNVGS